MPPVPPVFASPSGGCSGEAALLGSSSPGCVLLDRRCWGVPTADFRNFLTCPSPRAPRRSELVQ